MSAFARILAGLMIALWMGQLFGQSSNPRTTENQQLIWYGWFVKIPFDSICSVSADVQERHFVGPAAQHQMVFRGQLNQHWKKYFTTAFGFCLFLQSPNDPDASPRLMVPELRPHVEANLNQKFAHIQVDHRLRTEARFFHHLTPDGTALAEGYSFRNFRFRYQLALSLPIVKRANGVAVALRLTDELHLQTPAPGLGWFDQNRIYGGIQFAPTSRLAFDMGYLHWHQYTRNGTLIYDRDILRFTVNQQLGTRKA